jgi:hypothetical protein
MDEAPGTHAGDLGICVQEKGVLGGWAGVSITDGGVPSPFVLGAGVLCLALYRDGRGVTGCRRR